MSGPEVNVRINVQSMLAGAEKWEPSAGRRGAKSPVAIAAAGGAAGALGNDLQTGEDAARFYRAPRVATFPRTV